MRKMSRYAVAALFCVALFVLVAVGCLCAGQIAAHASSDTGFFQGSMRDYDISVVGQIVDGGLRNGYLITIAGSDAVYIYDMRGHYTLFVSEDGSPITVEDLT